MQWEKEKSRRELRGLGCWGRWSVIVSRLLGLLHMEKVAFEPQVSEGMSCVDNREKVFQEREEQIQKLYKVAQCLECRDISRQLE